MKRRYTAIFNHPDDFGFSRYRPEVPDCSKMLRNTLSCLQKVNTEGCFETDNYYSRGEVWVFHSVLNQLLMDLVLHNLQVHCKRIRPELCSY